MLYYRVFVCTTRVGMSAQAGMSARADMPTRVGMLCGATRVLCCVFCLQWWYTCGMLRVLSAEDVECVMRYF